MTLRSWCCTSGPETPHLDKEGTAGISKPAALQLRHTRNPKSRGRGVEEGLLRPCQPFPQVPNAISINPLPSTSGEVWQEGRVIQHRQSCPLWTQVTYFLMANRGASSTTNSGAVRRNPEPGSRLEAQQVTNRSWCWVTPPVASRGPELSKASFSGQRHPINLWTVTYCHSSANLNKQVQVQ